MVIEQGKSMLLFRFSNYKSTDFIKEHLQILNKDGFVWMLKLGRRSNIRKIEQIIADGGYMVLKAPKSVGGQYYIAKLYEVTETAPAVGYPQYYSDFIYDQYGDEQWFKLGDIHEMPMESVDSLVLEKNRNKVDIVISQTRTSVMFITVDKRIEI